MLLTVDEFRLLDPAPAFEDEALQLLLDAAEAEIIRAAGAGGPVQEWFTGGQRVIALGQLAGSITSIVEHGLWDGSSTTLETDDYLVDPGGYLLYRDSNGTNPRWRWYGRIVITYSPVDSDDIRKSVQADLAKLAMTYAPGVTSETVGSWTRQLASNSIWNASVEREAIMSRLNTPGRMVVV